MRERELEGARRSKSAPLCFVLFITQTHYCARGATEERDQGNGLNAGVCVL